MTGFAPSTTSGPFLEGPTILILNDSPLFRDAQAALLQSHGYRVLACATPEKAELVLGGNAVDLVIVDGDLGDDSYGPSGLSGSFIARCLHGRVRYIRFSMCPAAIPEELRGELCTDSISSVVDFLKGHFPAAQKDLR